MRPLKNSPSGEVLDQKPTYAKLRELRERTSLNRAEVARAIGWEYTTYQYYETKYNEPQLPLDLVIPLRELFLTRGGLSEDAVKVLLPPVEGLSHTPYRLAPLITWVQAGKPMEVWDETMADAPLYPVPNQPGRLFALKVEGASMSRVAPEGSIIVANLDDADPIDGRYYIARNGHGVTFKKFRANPPRLEPDSHETGYDTIFGDFELVARVVHVIRAL